MQWFFKFHFLFSKGHASYGLLVSGGLILSHYSVHYLLVKELLAYAEVPTREHQARFCTGKALVSTPCPN